MVNKMLRDAIYGLAVGDALGVPYEFMKRDSFKCNTMRGYGTYDKPAGTWSDDTSLTLATCRSIKECGGVNVEDMREKFWRWLHNGEFTADGVVFDVGSTTLEAIERGKGLNNENSQGNGSLMRILPLVFVDGYRLYIDDVSAITHAHIVPKMFCRAYLSVAHAIISGKEAKDIAEIKCRKGEPRGYIKSSGYVCDTYDAALWCLANTDNYKDAVLEAVNLGEDTDTTAAVAGGLAGIVYGYEAIPEEWLETLRGKDVIDSCLF